MANTQGLISAAKEIFNEALKRVDAGAAVRDAVRIDGANLLVRGEASVDLSRGLYVVAAGKAAYPMADAFSHAAGQYIKAGVISGSRPKSGSSLGPTWSKFFGGHPLPNEESLEAARACMQMLDQAGGERSPIIFLISGGGSAMMELPRDPRVTLPDLKDLNQVLVTSGASIAEINSVRRAVSSVKGGGLASRAVTSQQISLIISDTRSEDITSVASGPSLRPDKGIPDPISVIEKYGLEKMLPDIVTRSVKEHEGVLLPPGADSYFRVLLDNSQLVDQAAGIAREMGFVTDSDGGDRDDIIDEGVASILNQTSVLRRSVSADKPVCFVSGGEFGCEVKGNGFGGRNCETVLRAGLLAEKDEELRHYAFLSAGTDGIDGNSPAAGGVIDENTFMNARTKGLDPTRYLEDSDSYTFLKELDAAMEIGPTGTNVRDLRIVLAA